jgi:hypothetical protein
MDEIKFRGGAKIGKMSDSWPFVTLTASKDKLRLNAPIIGDYVFKPENIITIEPFTYFLNKGLRIKHNIKEYKENVEFWTFKDPQFILDQIRMIGFSLKGSIDPKAVL